MSCKQTKNVPDGKYLLKKNKVYTQGDKLDEAELEEIIRQKPNFKRFGVKWKLRAFNVVDSAKVADKRARKNGKLRVKNQKLRDKEDRINAKRIARAHRKDKEYFTEKIIPLKDTVTPRKFFREWLKYKIGKPPVIFDSIPYNKTIEQMSAYMRSKGYYYSTVSALVEYKKRKAKAFYSVVSGERYFIDSVTIDCDNPNVKGNYAKYIKKQEEHPLVAKPFDIDLLDDHRFDVATYMRNSALYGFSPNHIHYEVDTNRQSMKVNLTVVFLDRLIRPEGNPDTLIAIPHKTTYIRDVYFHIADTSLFDGNFSDYMDSLELSVMDGQVLRTIDSLDYNEVNKRNSNELDPKRAATFVYNGEMFIRPEILEMQNYLESTNYYKEEYGERTYTRLLQLGLFEGIKTKIIEIEGTNKLDVHYYLIPLKKQSFGAEPKATNSNGFLGVSATVNYSNRNLFSNGAKLTFSISGGFESQPPVFDENGDGQAVQTAARSFNTFEIGPSIKYEAPGLLPLRITRFSKRHRPRTVISTAYNFQRREEFSRGVFQLNYIWQFYVGKHQLFQAGLPGASVIKFVNLQKSPEFGDILLGLNDQFLLNSFSDQFVWQDWRFMFEYSMINPKKGKTQVYLTSSFDPAGNILSLFDKYLDTLDNGQKKVFGVAYAQFARMDNELIVYQPLGKEHSLNFRLNAGAGLPYGNSDRALPYDYSFFAGGANDNRGWRARSLGPGVYKNYLDTNSTATQIGDVRFGGSFEYRFPFNDLVKGALFFDAGNIWTIRDDSNREGGKFTSDWYKQLALAGGFGLRLDFDYFVIRVDLGIPLRNPSLPKNTQWIFQSNAPYLQALEDEFGTEYEKLNLPDRFDLQLHFGIGYPF
ncbi:MAG: BamA/TamA family outer membrane protein [Crocinitomicaceae bacterium]|nr:BamA/TamA family outer membrane protein [Crocinitomicaceae bacterium]